MDLDYRLSRNLLIQVFAGYLIHIRGALTESTTEIK